MENNKLALNVSGMGKALVDAAIEDRKNEMAKSAVAVVKDLMQSIENADDKIAEYEMYKRTYQARLAAIEAGEFTVTRNGTVEYNNSKLKGWLAE